MNELIISSLAHTWIIDVDGTICVHNGYKNGEDVILDGVQEFFNSIPSEDMIIILTSRSNTEEERLKSFLCKYGLRHNHIIFNAPMGERIIVNDDKPSGLKMAYAISKKRNDALDIEYHIDEVL